MKIEKWIWIIVVGAVVLLMFAGKKQALGEANWPSDCSFITNVVPYTSAYIDYTGTSAWIAADYDGNGVKEGFGYTSSKQSTARLDECNEASPSTKIIKLNYNSLGEDIFNYGTKLFVCSFDGTKSKYFTLNYGAASNAVTTCTGACADTCASLGYACGTYTICGVSTNCGTCPSCKSMQEITTYLNTNFINC